ncbi:pentapeptide repeat-containing protein [Paractinoplanes hotanensis]|uniref:Pentapeptide repeat-containing protein n=1 Tax=Paractinoplanes hotanensis TaxID=2906497 RepID=A0ABT0XT83_9ACTN|nr:pentapeptide repeat-containing protein [Actinoplanes hotanensis]MCM4076971.1 pentapeptide repeat-containing protein [Actinoplanes hotanensis]
MPERELHADCSRCAALCCVAPAFAKSSDFAINKAAGTPCRNLGGDFGCTIHERLDQSGFHGCVVFDCFGAGQRLTQETFGGRTWREQPRIAGDMFASLPVMRQLHELMWLVREALTLPEAQPVHGKLRDALARIDHLAAGSAADLRALDVDAQRRRVNPLLQRASELARASIKGRQDHRGAQLIGRKMRGADLRGASFRGALLIGADLRDADLRRADFTGADLRGADLRGADLTGVLFLTRSQRRAAVTSSG